MDYGKLNTLASELESADKCDATIVLAHEDPKTIAEGLGEGSVVDLVLGGHVHDNTQGTTSWGLPYVEPAYHAEAYTYSELVFEKASDTAATFKGVDKANYVPVDLTKTYKPENWADIENQQDQDNQIDLDPELVKMSDYCIEQVGQQLAEKLGYITEEALKGEFHPEKAERASGAGNFVAWLYAKMVGAQVGFVNHGGIRAEFVLEEGKDQRDIIVNDVYTLFPFDNKIYCFEITYEDLLQVFQYAVSTGGAKLLSHMVGVDCYYTGKTVNAIITPDGKKAYANGKWFDNWKNQKIRVAMSEYMATKNRKEEGDPDNPFCTWINTDRLISKDTIDAEGALSVLRSEAGENEGHLKIDNHTYYINEEYPDEKTPETDPTPGTDPAADSGKQTSQKNETEPAEGSQHTVGAGTYKISSAKNKTVTFVKAKATAASIKVPASVKISGKTYNVNKIGTKAFKGSKAKKVTIGANVTTIQKNAFKGSKATTIIIKTKKLKKAKVKGSLKGSKVKTIKVKVGKKKANKKYVKKYKKIFTKKNAGKKVTVK
jgi:hypothetical protein